MHTEEAMEEDGEKRREPKLDAEDEELEEEGGDEEGMEEVRKTKNPMGTGRRTVRCYPDSSRILLPDLMASAFSYPLSHFISNLCILLCQEHED
jgi:hypothetical protein